MPEVVKFNLYVIDGKVKDRLWDGFFPEGFVGVREDRVDYKPIDPVSILLPSSDNPVCLRKGVESHRLSQFKARGIRREHSEVAKSGPRLLTSVFLKAGVEATAPSTKILRDESTSYRAIDLKEWLLAERRRYIYQDLIKVITDIRYNLLFSSKCNNIRFAAVRGVVEYLNRFGPVSKFKYFNSYTSALNEGLPLPPKVPARYF